jgi:hypothetical protein
LSKDYEFEIAGHSSIYDGAARNLNIFFSEPDNGVNEMTGICLLIAGYGGHSQSNVYKKMRDQFSDKYNLVVIQCDYFGHEFMQKPPELSDEKQIIDFFFRSVGKEHWEKIKKSDHPVNVDIQRDYIETPDNFNDMSIMQTVDNLTAITAVIEIINDNGLKFNAKRIISYGHSHGAYLALMANVFAPGLFSLIIDNSAYLFPIYVDEPRKFSGTIGNLVGEVKLNYKAKQWVDYELLDLKKLYDQLDSFCSIVTFQGETDSLVKSSEKERFCRDIRAEYFFITKNKVDGIMLKSTNHGLDADFLLLFDHVLKKVDFEIGSDLEICDIDINTISYKYYISYENKLPVITRNPRIFK